MKSRSVLAKFIHQLLFRSSPCWLMVGIWFFLFTKSYYSLLALWLHQLGWKQTRINMSRGQELWSSGSLCRGKIFCARYCLVGKNSLRLGEESSTAGGGNLAL